MEHTRMMSDENATPEHEVELEDGQDAAARSDAEDRLALLEAENSDLRDKLLRTAAEMDNLRKRTEREVNDTRSYAIAGFARDMLVATDNLSRALMVMPAEDREAAEGTLKSLIEGIEMTEREMQRLLQKNGVKPIIADGEKFDPHKHQAMFEVPDTSVPEGTVVQVMQAGYAIGDRILRPAMVGVAKGGPKRAPAPEPEALESEPTDIETEAKVDKSV
jgi:molecular chaperone GrpE